MIVNPSSQASTPSFDPTDTQMPVLFVGHGSPMNAIEDNEYSRSWIEMGKTLPRPQAILCISAHWETYGVNVTATEQPATIHDFRGFPEELNNMQYPVPGSLALAKIVQRSTRLTLVHLDQRWGLDHGAWSVLCRLFPDADIPVVQLSLDHTQSPEFHYEMGEALRPLRYCGVMIIGSGNIVHNLSLATFQEGAFDWAVEFDETAKRLISSGEHQPLIHYEDLGPMAEKAIPTNEHYLPLLYTLALQEPGETLHYFTEGVTYGSISMRSFKIG